LWHKDIAVNGIMTSITTVLGDGYFEIKPDDPDSQVSYKLKLSPNSLVVLSGDSRWRWVHRVIRKHQDSVSAGIINRISLVLGCR
jgi:alkylated DNA repair dioxygenase AlkB